MSFIEASVTINSPTAIFHRNQFSIFMLQKTVLFLPDIDKWSRWEKDLTKILKDVDYAFIDATFFDVSECLKYYLTYLLSGFR